MQRVLPYFIALCVALWLGGLVALFIFISVIFNVDHDLGVLTGPILFHVFERYQITLAAIALVSAIVWRLYSPTRSRRMLLACLLLATLLAIVQFTLITRQMDRALDADDMPKFRRLHGYSMLIYTGTTAVMLLGGAALITAIEESRDAAGRKIEPRV